MISDEAVEAAAKASYEFQFSGFRAWDDLSGHEKSEAIAAQKFALEAAAPHMPCPDAASVWDEAANVLYMGNTINQDHLKAMWERNPYRSQ